MSKKYSSTWAVLGPLMRFVPKNLLSYVVGLLVSMKWPALIGEPAKRLFVAAFNINMDEAEKPLKEYESINELFTRRLKEGIRPVQGDLVHPVDGVLSRAGVVPSDYLVQAKGKSYSINEFLKEGEAERVYQGGMAATYYLCPSDYHRVHSPISGDVIECTYVPGGLWPVNAWSVENISQLFCRNERLILKIRWRQDPSKVIAYVMVGATNVGKMTLAIDPQVVTNNGHMRLFHRKTYKPPIPIQVGQELGQFNMGSTVVVIYPEGVAPHLSVESQPVQLGQPFKS